MLSPMSPTDSPSTYTRPTSTRPVIGGAAVDQVDHHAVLGDHHALLGHPVCIARAPLARRCRHSPCTGMTLLGRTAL